MRPEIKEWLEALPKYRQTHNALKRGESFCCLGVYSDLKAKQGKGKWSKNIFIDEYGFQNKGALTPALAKELFGDPSNAAGEMPFRGRLNTRYAVEVQSLNSTYEQTHNMTLAEANDEGCTFEQITDLIKYFFGD